MKKIRMSICIMLLVFAMCSMTGCGSNDNTTTETTTQMPTSSVAPSTTMETTMGSGNTETDTGVIEGLVDDVEKGVDDMTGDDRTTKAADESR